MKLLLVLSVLLAGATRLFATDDGGDGVKMPSYQELVREGYARHAEQEADIYNIVLNGRKSAPKPTQAYYDAARHCTIYYGFKMVSVSDWDPSTMYAGGYPVEFYRKLLPPSLTDVNLNNVAVVVKNRSAVYSQADTATVAQPHHAAISTVQKPAKKAADQ